MIALADQTRLTWAAETIWGQAATSGFRTLPISTENLTGSRRHIRPPILGVRPILPLEENASGEIDTLASPDVLAELLRLVLMTSPISETASIQTQSGITLPKNLADAISSDDVLWLGGDVGWVRYVPPAAAGQNGTLASLAGATLTPASPATLALNRLTATPSTTSNRQVQSVTINKRYGATGDWVQLTGMTMRRLDLATSADSLVTATASFLGKQASLQSTAFPAATSYADTQPYSLAAADIHLRLLRQGETLDLNTTTGLRLVLEYPAMQPRFVLGALTPQAVLVGELHVHGVIEVMATGHDLNTWFGRREVLALECGIEFGGGGGFGFRIPRLRIAETSNSVLVSGDPVRQVLRFDADADTSDTTTPLIACYLAGRD